jgi:hypothetical protein
VTRLVGLVADYGPGDLRFAETIQRLALLAPQAELSPTRVADGDTLAAGLCVADLALSPGPPGRVVVHDVTSQARDRCVWIGRTRDGALVVGADRGYAWSFVAPRLRELCALDVPADAELTRAAPPRARRWPRRGSLRRARRGHSRDGRRGATLTSGGYAVRVLIRPRWTSSGRRGGHRRALQGTV